MCVFMTKQLSSILVKDHPLPNNVQSSTIKDKRLFRVNSVGSINTNSHFLDSPAVCCVCSCSINSKESYKTWWKKDLPVARGGAVVQCVSGAAAVSVGHG